MFFNCDVHSLVLSCLNKYFVFVLVDVTRTINYMVSAVCLGFLHRFLGKLQGYNNDGGAPKMLHSLQIRM